MLGAVVAALWLAGPLPLPRPLGNANLLVFFVGAVVAGALACMRSAFPFGLGVLGDPGLAASTPVRVLVGHMDERISHLAVPFFGRGNSPDPG